MAEWTDDALEYLDGYLRQVAALARRNGDDVDEIVDGLREHIEHKATLGGAERVDVDLLIEVLHEVGSPSDVIEMDAEALARARSAAPPRCPAPAAAPQPRPQKQVIVQKSNTGKWIFATVLLLLFVVSIPVLLIIAAIVIPNMAQSREAVELVQERQELEMLEAQCVANLERIGKALKMYAADNGGRYPIPFDDEGNVRGFELEFMQLYPDYIENQNYGFCPAVMDEVGPVSSYAYPYMAAQSEAGFKTFGMQYSHVLQADAEGQPIPNAYKSVTFAHVSTGDLARTPLVIERPQNHGGDGGHVLYLDGHVEFIEYGTKYPMNDEFFETLEVFRMCLNEVQGRIDEGRVLGF